MSFDKYVVCVCTTKPSMSLSPSGGGGSMTVIDPITGGCLSSIRVAGDMSGKSALGISTISAFPPSFTNVLQNSNNRLVMAYGSNEAKKGDTYAMLLSIRAAASPPLLHWKCRLPEADMTGGLTISPCGYYVVGGGASGTCFVWSSTGKGSLIRAFKAHYRSVTCLAWSDCGRYLVTGGEDGMVHSFSLMELVDQSGRNSKRTIAPLHTWSFHHFPVSCLIPMDSGRMASGAEDGHIEIMELFSKKTVSTIKVPDGITCLSYHDSRLYAGTTGGTIFSMDLDAYAMHQTEKHGASLSQAERQRQEQYLTDEERIFGKTKEGESASTRLYRSDFVGHERSISAIALFVEDNEERLISGDQLGQVRIWDIGARTCVQVLQPWSNTSTGAAAAAAKNDDSKTGATPTNHPISSIMVIGQPLDTSTTSGGMFASSSTSHNKGQLGVANLIPPLQKFSHEQQQSNASSGGVGSSTTLTPIPFLKLNRSTESLTFWQARTMTRKRRQSGTTEQDGQKGSNAPKGDDDDENLEEARQKIARLEEELASKTAEVERWEKVNNKLMAKLKGKSG